MTDFFTSPSLNTAPALYFLDTEDREQYFTFAEYFSHRCAIAHLLEQQDFQRGDRLAFIAHNSPETASLLLTCLQMGIIAMPLSPRFPPNIAQELVRIAKARLMALPTHFEAQTRIEVLPTDAFSFEQDATILCTSGSTGLPKLILHTAANHYWSAVGAAENIPFGAGDCWLQSLPFYHVGGYSIFFRSVVGDAAIAFPSTNSFDVRLLTQTLERLPVTHCSFVATQLYHALDYAPLVQQLRRLKAIVLGGSAIPQTLTQQALDEGLKIFTSYGSTEMASQISTSISSEASELRASGTVLPHREVCVSDDGEILVRGKTLARGRVSEQGMVPLVDEDGWYHTRDLGGLDSMRRLTVLGRRDNMFISGGENIHPETIEQVLYDRADVVQAIVVPVPHEIYGFRPVAFVQREDDANLDAAWLHAVRADLAIYLPRFAVPDQFLIFPSETLTSGIKPSRSTLRHIAEVYVAGLSVI
jgi:o-succinylbenzoate---CoA ligase